MNRPYIICHILASIDGKVSGAMFGSSKVRSLSDDYSNIREEYNGDAWCFGTVTTQEFLGYKKPLLPQSDKLYSGDYIVNNNADLYYVSIDTKGELGWDSNTYHKSNKDLCIIEILLENTSNQYKEYLRNKNINYIIAGKDNLDLNMACNKLYNLFNIKKMLVCGGGVINYSFLNQGCLDELSLVLASIVDGNDNPTSIFKSYSNTVNKPYEFNLDNVNKLDNDGLHITYKVDYK